MTWKCFFGFHKWIEDKTKINGYWRRFCNECGGRQRLSKCSASDTWQWKWGLNIMADQPKLIKATVAFNKVTLRKTILALFDNDIYQVTSKILDKDTLKVHVIRNHFTKPSMHALVSMYLQEFINLEDTVFEDWVTKSDTLKS